MDDPSPITIGALQKAFAVVGRPAKDVIVKPIFQVLQVKPIAVGSAAPDR